MDICPDNKAKAARLEESRVFRDFDWPELCMVASFMTCRDLPSGEVLFEEGGPGDFMALLTAGVVSVVKKRHGLGEIMVGDIHVRQVVGEQALLDGQPRSATVYAQTPVELLVLRREGLDRIMEAYPRVGAKLVTALARVVSERLRRTTGQLACQGDRDLLTR